MKYFSGTAILLQVALAAASPRPGPVSAGECGAGEHSLRESSGRIILLPTAIPIPSGTVRFSLHEFFIPSLGIGLTDRLSLSGGASLIPGADHRISFLASSFTPLLTDGFALSGGMWISHGDGDGAAGMGYFNLTCGGAGGSATVGMGWGFRRAGGPGGAFVFGGGSLRVSGETDIISEVLFPPNLDPSLFAFGARWRGKDVSIEVAVVVGFGLAGLRGVPMPWTSVSAEL